MTVSMLEVEHGRLKKELRKLLRWLESEPRPDVVNLPYTLLLGLAGPLKKALDAPICCTLQGEDLFLEGLHEPYRTRCARSDPPAHSARRMFSRRERLLCRVHVPLPGDSGAQDRSGAAGGEHGRIPAWARPAPKLTTKSRSAISRALRRKRVCTSWRKRIAWCGSRNPNCYLEAAGYMAPEHRAYLDGIERQLRQWDLPFHYRGVLDRAQKIAFLESLDVLSTPTVYADPKGIFVLEAMAAGVPFVQPDHGTFREMRRGRAAASWWNLRIPQSLAEGLLSVIRDPQLRAALARKAYDGVRAHYTVEQMAEQTVTIFGRQRETVGSAYWT